MKNETNLDLQQLLDYRFGDAPRLDGTEPHGNLIDSMAARGSCRTFLDKAVPDGWVEMLCAVALAAPSKSDLQQRDIVLLKSPIVRRSLVDLIEDQDWVAEAPMMAVFCGNNRRQRLLHERRGIPFANDHLDAFFNAIGDAAIALGAFVTAAEALGLGCCPISAVRNKAAEVSVLLGLPEYVFPFAGLAFGFPTEAPAVSKRLPLNATCHTDRYQEDKILEKVDRYDAERAKAQPYGKQRYPSIFAESNNYAWSEDKVRQYSQSERGNFGQFVRAQGFSLD
ncbi:nitroreductase family protein [Ruegeria arenilitoris]|uniref:nitroreductase family protein n=1 Tax=Ruegeria arenilitoris TaxID=1173585 RepID=UPI001481A429|nr:nitroreductase family protein [Ruegeria arenilitoris]